MDRMKPTEIGAHETFANLFPIKTEVLSTIEEHIRENRFLISHPLDLATWRGQKEPVCIDGYTRLQAAKNVGLEGVPVITHELDTEDEALELAIHLQRNRRNMTDADIIACIQAVDSRKQRGGDRRSKDAESKASRDAIEKSPSKSAKETADLLGISTTKVERARVVLDHADPETLEAVKLGDISVNKAHGETQKKRRAKKAGAKSGEPASPNTANTTSDVSATVLPCDEGETARAADTYPREIDGMTITLKPDQYRALRDLGDTIEYHVELAVDLYLRMVADEVEEDENEERTKVVSEIPNPINPEPQELGLH